MIEFSDAVVSGDKQTIRTSRDALVTAIGPEATVDAAGVISNFQRMVRIADGTGIPLDAPMQVMSEDVRESLHINDYVAAVNSKSPSFFKKWLFKIIVVPKFRKMVKKTST
jgi:hypothetical protein